ncbi:MAG: hypothetical protein EXS50_03665 [Candidatus Taylorbacteria bacterium]|nr:hypothetical protein [Candidatus Taylorbacteria bacterium]
MKLKIILPVLIIVLILTTFNFYKKQAGTSEVKNTPTSTATPASEKSFEITATDYAFSPKTITVKKGDTVKITLKNTAGFHDFKIDEFNASTSRVNEGKNATVQFVADKAGTFQYYCSVGKHRSMGMWGIIIVQ